MPIKMFYWGLVVRDYSQMLMCSVAAVREWRE